MIAKGDCYIREYHKFRSLDFASPADPNDIIISHPPRKYAHLAIHAELNPLMGCLEQTIKICMGHSYRLYIASYYIK